MNAAIPHVDATRSALATRQEIGALLRAADRPVLALVQVHRVDRLCAGIGHERTGAMIAAFAGRLSAAQRTGDSVVPVGDRKFAVVLNGLRNRGHILLAANRMLRCADELADGEGRLEVSVGIVTPPDGRGEPGTLLQQAEVALLNGRHCARGVSFYDAEAADELADHWHLEGRLAAALERGDLLLHYQPKVALPDCAPVGAEALMRWFDAADGPVSPDVFIAVAESTGLITELTQFAIQRACHQWNSWPADMRGLNIAVNVTPSLIRDSGIVEMLRSACQIWDVPPPALTVEVTENALMADPVASHEVLLGVRAFGARVSIDDFGTGYSSLAYLKDIPADELKVDRSFVMGMLEDAGNRKIVEHVIGLAHAFGLTVVAEGVEDAKALAELCRLGCDYAQGYHMSKPLPGDEFVSWFADQPPT